MIFVTKLQHLMNNIIWAVRVCGRYRNIDSMNRIQSKESLSRLLWICVQFLFVSVCVSFSFLLSVNLRCRHFTNLKFHHSTIDCFFLPSLFYRFISFCFKSHKKQNGRLGHWAVNSGHRTHTLIHNIVRLSDNKIIRIIEIACA